MSSSWSITPSISSSPVPTTTKINNGNDNTNVIVRKASEIQAFQTHYATEYSTLSGFGLKQLQKFGFTIGDGLGKNKDGTTTYVDIDKKIDMKGLGTQIIEDNLHIKIQDAYEQLLQRAKPVKADKDKKKDKKKKDKKKRKSSKNDDDNDNDSDDTNDDNDSDDKKKRKKKSKDEKKHKKKSSSSDSKKEKKRKSRSDSDDSNSEDDEESTEKTTGARAVERSFLITTAVGKDKRVQQANMSQAMMDHLEKLKQIRDQDKEKVKNRSFLTEEQKEALASSKKKRKIN